MTVTPEDKAAMARILAMMEGKSVPDATPASRNQEVELAGPGQVTTAEVNAMADVLRKLNNVADQTVGDMITESTSSTEVKMALETTRNNAGVKVGTYQIMIKEDEKRLAGKQYYSIYNTRTGDVIADDLSLYETALSVVKMLNGGMYANNIMIRKLFELDDKYTSHRQDALRYKRGMMVAEKKQDWHKKDLYESRYTASIDRAMSAKKELRETARGTSN